MVDKHKLPLQYIVLTSSFLRGGHGAVVIHSITPSYTDAQLNMVWLLKLHHDQRTTFWDYRGLFTPNMYLAPTWDIESEIAFLGEFSFLGIWLDNSCL